jgi:hypothetical protein
MGRKAGSGKLVMEETKAIWGKSEESHLHGQGTLLTHVANLVNQMA